jgi:acyl carrier protein
MVKSLDLLWGDAMNIRERTLSEIRAIANDQKAQLAPLTDDLRLIDSGLDSLGFAILVIRLEDELGVDPFTSAGGVAYPETLGDLLNLYENATARA